jgi:hypothetical protein
MGDFRVKYRIKHIYYNYRICSDLIIAIMITIVAG